MLSTCEICRRRGYCDNCAMAEDCYWIKAIPPEGGRRKNGLVLVAPEYTCGSWVCEEEKDE